MSAAAAALLALVTSSTSADPLTRSAERFYGAEETAGAAIAIVGAVSVLTSAIFVLEEDELYIGAAIPFVALGAFRVAVGGSAYFSSADDLADAKKHIRRDPASFRSSERARLRSDDLYYDIMLSAEVASVLVGTAVGVAAARADARLVAGIGYGFAGQALLMFVFDLVASSRVAGYLKGLGPVTIAPAVSVVTKETDGRATFGVRGRF